MAKRILKDLALKLRLEDQMSYSQIKKRVKVSKSTLSLWLRDHPLSEERIRELKLNYEGREVQIERCRETKLRKRNERFLRYKDEERLKIGVISDRELMFLGLALYWGEGGKTANTQLCISNTDPGVLKVALAWYTRVLEFEMNKIQVRLQLYLDMDVKKEQMFWSNELRIPPQNFAKAHIKKTTSFGLSHRGRFGHGTCELRVYGVEGFERVMANLQLLSGYFD